VEIRRFCTAIRGKEGVTPRLEPGDEGHNNRVKKASAVKELNAKAGEKGRTQNHRAKTPVKKRRFCTAVRGKKDFTPVLEPGDCGHNNKVKRASAVKELNAKAC